MWEYLVAVIHNYSESNCGLEVIGRRYHPVDDSYHKNHHPMKVMELLNDLGSDRWELVPGSAAGNNTLTFKRPIT